MKHLAFLAIGFLVVAVPFTLGAAIVGAGILMIRAIEKLADPALLPWMDIAGRAYLVLFAVGFCYVIGRALGEADGQ